MPKNDSNFIMLMLYSTKGDNVCWTGVSEKRQNDDEEPVILNIKNQSFYFYSEEVKIVKFNSAEKKLYYSFSWLDDEDKQKIKEHCAKVFGETNMFPWNIKMKLIFKDIDNKFKALEKEVIEDRDRDSILWNLNFNIRSLTNKWKNINQQMNIFKLYTLKTKNSLIKHCDYFEQILKKDLLVLKYNQDFKKDFRNFRQKILDFKRNEECYLSQCRKKFNDYCKEYSNNNILSNQEFEVISDVDTLGDLYVNLIEENGSSFLQSKSLDKISDDFELSK